MQLFFKLQVGYDFLAGIIQDFTLGRGDIDLCVHESLGGSGGMAPLPPLPPPPSEMFAFLYFVRLILMPFWSPIFGPRNSTDKVEIPL